MGKETNIEIEYSATTFVPSYERKQQKEVPFTPPSYGEKFISTFITATVWAGVLVTLPLTFFWVFKKEKENEKILVRRLGKLQDTQYQIAGRIPVLPLIDDEIIIDLSDRNTTIESRTVPTVDRCMVDISGNAKWSIFNSVAADSNTKDVVGDTNRLIGMIIQKQIVKSTIREIATERKRIETKIFNLINDELAEIGVNLKNLEVEIQPSKNQPFIQEEDDGMPKNPGLGGAIEQANSQSNMIQDVLSGMVGHPGFSNIVASVVQTVEEVNNKQQGDQFKPQVYTDLSKQTVTTGDCDAGEGSGLLSEPDMEFIKPLIDQKLTPELVASMNTTLLLSGSNGKDILIDPLNRLRKGVVSVVMTNSTGADCTIKISNSKLAQILSGQLSYKNAYVNGDVQISGDPSDLANLTKLFS